MKIYIILLISLVLLFIIVINVNGTNVEDGKKMFDEKCGICHGKKSDVPSISKLSQLSVQDITDKVRNGVEGTMMRGFSKKELSDDDLNNIIAYLKNPSSNNSISSNNSTPSNKSVGFDIIFGIVSILVIYFICHKSK